MINVALPDGRTFTAQTEDETEARRQAREFLETNPKPEEPEEPEQKPETESEGTLQEIGEGIVSGGIGIVQGIGELAASAIDLAIDTNYASDVTDFADEVRRAGGIDPVGFAGKGAEILTQFVVPGVAAANILSKTTKLGKLARSGAELTKAEKAGLAAEQIAAAGLADAIVATDGITTIGDFFDGGPTVTEKDIGLQGREEAWRRITNKLKIGAETGTIVATAPAILGGALTATGAVAGKVGDVVAPGLSPIARAVKKSAPVKNTKDYLDRIADERVFKRDEQGFVDSVLSDTLSVLRYRGSLPEEVAAERAVIKGISSAEAKEAERTLKQLNKALEPILKGQSDLVKVQTNNALEAFLNPSSVGKNTEEARKVLLEALPPTVRPIAQKMRSQIDRLSKDIQSSALLKRLKEEGIQVQQGPRKGESVADVINDTVEKNLNTYLRRNYRAALDPDYKPDKETIDLALSGFKGDKDFTVELLKRSVKPGGVKEGSDLSRLGFLDDGTDLVGSKVTNEQAKVATDQFLKEYKSKFGARNKGGQAARVSMERLRTGMFENREMFKEYQRRLLGEIKDPQEAFLGTIADLSEFKAVDKFYGNVAKLAESKAGIGKFFVKRTSDADPVPDGYITLGNLENLSAIGVKDTPSDAVQWGALQGYAVPERVYADLTKQVKDDLANPAANLVRATYSSFLRAKGYSQYGKTVLSPITQIRNVTSAALFAAAQGNVGKGANVFESVGLVWDDILKKTSDEQLKELQELQELGVIGSQAELQELRALIKEGWGTEGVYDKASRTKLGRELAQRVSRSEGADFLDSAGKKIRGVGKVAEDFYQGGDNVWKIYNYKFEQNKLRNALSKMEDGGEAFARERMTKLGQDFVSVDDFLKKEAADIVKNTVPNYNLAPDAIKELRKLPFGNFIAFPYEIMRTGINTIGRGLDELASTNKEIQKIGLRRLSGAATTFGIAPVALSEFAYAVSGVTEEEMDAFKRSLAAPWEKNARLIPTGRDKNGLPTYINYSYTNPYDMLERTLTGALNKVEEGQKLGKSGDVIAFEAAKESLSELLGAFTDESIITAKLLDVTIRGGRTETGALVYNPQEDSGTKIGRSFLHILDGIVPSVAPVDISGKGFEAGRFTRSFMSATGLNDLAGISEKDRQGREKQFAGELVRAFTGVTENTIDRELALKYKAYEFAKARQQSSNIFNRVARSLNITDPNELLDAYNEANDARYRATNAFHQTLEDVKTLGLSRFKIRRILKEKTNVGGIDEILRGRYEPLKISDSVEKDMRSIGNYRLLPRGEIRSLQRKDRRRGFGAEERPDPKPVEETQVQPQAETPNVVSTRTPLQSVASITPQSTSTPLTASSSVLTPNFRTQQLLRDLETRRG